MMRDDLSDGVGRWVMRIARLATPGVWVYALSTHFSLSLVDAVAIWLGFVAALKAIRRDGDAS